MSDEESLARVSQAGNAPSFLEAVLNSPRTGKQVHRTRVPTQRCKLARKEQKRAWRCVAMHSRQNEGSWEVAELGAGRLARISSVCPNLTFVRRCISPRPGWPWRAEHHLTICLPFHLLFRSLAFAVNLAPFAMSSNSPSSPQGTALKQHSRAYDESGRHGRGPSRASSMCSS